MLNYGALGHYQLIAGALLSCCSFSLSPVLGALLHLSSTAKINAFYIRSDGNACLHAPGAKYSVIQIPDVIGMVLFFLKYFPLLFFSLTSEKRAVSKQELRLPELVITLLCTVSDSFIGTDMCKLFFFFPCKGSSSINN